MHCLRVGFLLQLLVPRNRPMTTMLVHLPWNSSSLQLVQSVFSIVQAAGCSHFFIAEMLIGFIRFQATRPFGAVGPHLGLTASDPRQHKSRCGWISLPCMPYRASFRLMATPAWGPRRAYLALYNCLLCAGWVQVLVSAVLALKDSGHTAVYDAVARPLQIWQTAALLEIFNSLVGIVRSPVSATLPQIASRLYVTWGVLWSFPEVRKHWLVAVLVLSWSITEVIRYTFFALKEAFGWTPGFLQWLRYSTFFLLYPTGITGEVGLTLLALSHMKASGLYSVEMPNKLNFAFSYYYASLLVLLCYVPGSPFMYTYMIGQRNKTLGTKKTQ